MGWEPVVVGVLGATRALRCDGAQISFSSRPAKRALLCFLAAHRGQTVPASVIAQAIWPQVDVTENQLLSRLRHNVSTLRDDLGDVDRKIVVTNGPGYCLNLDEEGIDADIFTALARRAIEVAPNDPRRGLRIAHDARKIWDEPYLDVRYCDFAQLEITRLELLNQQLTSTIIESHLNVGNYQLALCDLEAAGRWDHRDERLVSLRMLALHRAGRQSDALGVFSATVDDLATSGLEVSTGLAELEKRIFVRDPKLHRLKSPIREIGPDDSRKALIGRSDEVATVRRLSREHRLLTVCGVGGLGKTAVVRAAAQTELVDGFDLTYVDIASSSTSVHHALAGALNIRSAPGSDIMDQIVETLQYADVTIVLDNCEPNLQDVAATCSALLKCTNSVRIVVTSRRPLGIAGEYFWTLPPMEASWSEDSFESVRSSASYRLPA